MNTATQKEQTELLYDKNTQEPIPVIVSFGKSGGMIPVYFMVEDVRLKVNKILWQSNNKLWGNQYRCEVVLNERVWTVDLFYYSTQRLWTMKKM